MFRLLFIMLIAGSLAGCGLGATAVSTAAGSTSELKQAQEAKKTEAQVTKQLDDAARQAEQQRKAAEAEAQ